MQTALLVLAAIITIGWGCFGLDVLLGQKYIRFLGRIRVPPKSTLAELPTVSVVFAARNEERHVRETLRSLLALNYPALEIVAVDDRSEDATGAILDEVACSDPRLIVEHVDALPGGWLGKNHALYCGAVRARGEILLFTDADVVFESTVLARAVCCMEEDRLDHLTGPADIRTPTLALELFVATFALFFNGFFRPWRMAAPGRQGAIGFGAFNLVRKDAYNRAGTHRVIALRADDDLRLGQRLGLCGARQAFAVVDTLLQVEWYASLPEAMRGLEKNTLAAVDFSLSTLMVGSLGQLIFTVWPFVALYATSGGPRILNLLAVILMIAVQIYLLRRSSIRAWTAVALPLGTLLVVYTYARAAILTYARGGIRWRGTFYSLEELKGSSGKSG